MSLIDFNVQQKLIQSEVKKFATSEIESIADQIDKACVPPAEIVSKLSNLGLSSLIIPEKYGGSGLDTTSLCIAIEELSKTLASIGAILCVNNCLAAYPIIKYGNESQKDLYLNKLAKGEIGAYAADIGIDAQNKIVEVKIKNGELSISGAKEFVLNGEIASFFILPISVINKKAIYILPKENQTINITRPQILGIRSAGIIGLEFNDTKLPKDLCLVPEDKGEKCLEEISTYAHIGFAAISLGIAEASLKASIKYSRERKQFGKAICEFPMVQEMLVDMNTNIEATRLLVYDAAARFDRGRDFSSAAKIARLFSSDAAVFSGIKAIQIHGGYGYTKDYPVERYLRDAKVLQVLERPPHDIKSRIAKELLS